jgi:cytochrome c biogenesis protein ResB
VNEHLLRAYVWLKAFTTGLVRDETGEGVISAAIAVLIMAGLGALMWVGFKEIWTHTSSQTDGQISQIGGP